MKRIVALLSVFLLLVSMFPLVSAEDVYNDENLNWGEHTSHVYTDCVDISCNVCGAIREAAEHVFDNACDPDCNVCGTAREVGEHVYDDDADLDCNQCGYVRVAADDPADFAYEIQGNVAYITGYAGEGGDVAIPATLGGYPVAALSKESFRNVVTPRIVACSFSRSAFAAFRSSICAL